MRLFLAIPIEDRILDALAAAVESLRASRAAVRWVRPEGMHLTIKFLGETEPERVGSLVEAVGKAAAGIEPFPVTVSGSGAYPDLRRPRVIWAGVREPSGSLQRLWKATDQATSSLGWEREVRPFSPHITLGRVKGPMNLPRLSEAVRALEEEHWGDQEVPALVLFRSRLKPGGAEYERIHVFRLGRK